MRYFILTIIFLAAGVVSAAPTYSEFDNYNDGNLLINTAKETKGDVTSDVQSIQYNARNNYWLASVAEYEADGETLKKSPLYRATLSLTVAGEENLVYELYQIGGDWSVELKNNAAQTVQLPSLSDMKDAKTSYGIRVSDNLNEPQLLFSSYRKDLYQTAFTHVGNGTVDFTTGIHTDPSKEAQFTFGSPLPTPVITLLIALGFGAAFAMYRNRKQVKA